MDPQPGGGAPGSRLPAVLAILPAPSPHASSTFLAAEVEVQVSSGPSPLSLQVTALSPKRLLATHRWLGLGGKRDEQSEGGWGGESVEEKGRKGRGFRTLPGGEEKPSPGKTLGV